MKKFYDAPLAEVLEFGTMDVITTSGDDSWGTGQSANDDDQWSEEFKFGNLF